jgi:hypothetical protein
MRRINLFSYLIVAIASALITYLIFGTTTDPVTPEPDTPEPTENTKEICMKYDDEDMSTLDADLVHTMTKEYINSQWEYINSNSNFISKHSSITEDARSIWFDLKTLKKYLYHIENESRKVDSTIKEDKLGIRIYYGVYPNKEEIKKFPDIFDTSKDRDFTDYSGLHTLVMIPTISIEDKILDFNPLDDETYKIGLYKVEKYMYNNGTPIPNNNTMGLFGTSRDIAGQNHGTLYPPGPATGMGF